MFATLFGKNARKHGPVTGRQAWTGSMRLQVETLEDRTVPSTLGMEAAQALTAHAVYAPDYPVLTRGELNPGGPKTVAILYGKLDPDASGASLQRSGGKIGDGTNGGDDFTGSRTQNDAIALSSEDRSGEEIPTYTPGI